VIVCRIESLASAYFSPSGVKQLLLITDGLRPSDWRNPAEISFLSPPI
jgi:hypothetical protein